MFEALRMVKDGTDFFRMWTKVFEKERGLMRWKDYFNKIHHAELDPILLGGRIF